MTTHQQQTLLLQLKQATGNGTILSLLQQLSVIPFTRAAYIKSYHEQLLLLKAFPGSKAVHAAATAELARMASAIQKASPACYAGLCGDGIVYTELICNYSLAMTSWLAATFSASVRLHSCGADPETVRKTMQLLCPPAEFEKATQDELTLAQRMTAITGLKHPASQLQWLLQAFAGSAISPPIREELFRQLKVFVQWKINLPPYSRTFLHFHTGRLFLQQPVPGTVNSKRLIRQQIHPPVQLTAPVKAALCATAKTSLALLCRETEPVTHADEQAVELFNMGRGFSIALLYLQPDKRLSLDSYIGFMAFKNGVPVSYGGGWIFGHRCKIGVNIYPAFRKGESKWIFCQVLRLYHQYFNVSCFTVNPYQFGKRNPEGLKSGAFWFYYRLGFRPMNQDLNELANTEWNKISTLPGYRTSLSVLKKFTAGPLVLDLKKPSFPGYDAADFSSAISRQLNLICNADRTTALAEGRQILHKKYGISGSNETLALLCLLADQKKWLSKKEMKAVSRVWMLKDKGKEKDFIAALQCCTAFWKLADAVMQT